ncbi:MAG TPA: transposase [Syntrophorhabdaceae bacterium]
MPRHARIDLTGVLHHVIIRGIEQSSVFEDSKDCENFLARLGAILTETGTSCYAWALLTNHGHFLIRTGAFPLSTVMGRLLTGYAQQFNRRHTRHGHLFQNRYKAFLVEDEPYFLELIRYIHLNPIRAGIIHTMKELDHYPRTGHAVIMGKLTRSWQDTSMLGLFGQKAQYRRFVEKGISLGPQPELTGGGLIRSARGRVEVKELRREGVKSDERILGRSDFVDSVLRRAEEASRKRLELKETGLTLETLIKDVARHFNTDEGLIRSPIKQRTVSRTRAIIVHLALDRLRIMGVEAGKVLNLTPSAISRLAARGRTDPLSREIEGALPVFKSRG